MVYYFSSDDNVKEFLDTFFSQPMVMQKKYFRTYVTIKKGTKLYRFRRDDGSDLLSPSAWGLAPKDKVKQGRFNKEKEPLLYVATSNTVLGREIRLKENEVYYEAVYECKKDFQVSSLFSADGIVPMLLHKISLSIEDNSCLLDSELNKLQDKVVLNKVYDVLNFYLSPFYIYSILDNLYDYTNKIGFAAMNENGLRYASIYEPFELSGGKLAFTLNGIENGNIVLTDEGTKNIDFLSAKRKVYKNDVELSMYIEMIEKIKEIEKNLEVQKELEQIANRMSKGDMDARIQYLYDNKILVDI